MYFVVNLVNKITNKRDIKDVFANLIHLETKL